MAVNGGGGVTLQFQRSPLKAITRTTFLPWNQIVTINQVIMTPVGAAISWDQEDTSLKVIVLIALNTIKRLKKSSHKFKKKSHSYFRSDILNLAWTMITKK